MKRLLLYSGATVAAVIVLAVLVVGSGYLYSLRLTAPAEVPGIATLVPAEGIHLGSTVRASVELELPLFRRENKVVAEPGDGATLVGEPEIDRGSWRWSRQVWRIAAELRPFRPGTVQPGVLTLELSPEKSGGEPVLFTVTIPDFSAGAAKVAPNAELQLADAVTVTKSAVSNRLWWLLLIPAALLIWFLWRRRRKRAPELPPWERAMLALHALRGELRDHRIPLETGFVRLTDLVRSYLETRFEIPASTRTTPEFLAELNSRTSPLPEAQRPFLRDFMTAADQVKFAKAPPSGELLDDALSRAEELVESTRIRPEESVGGGEK